jgi:hypothetical protein
LTFGQQSVTRNGDAGLVHPNGTLTPLGQLYNTFAAGTNLTEINITEPQWNPQLKILRMRIPRACYACYADVCIVCWVDRF